MYTHIRPTRRRRRGTTSSTRGRASRLRSRPCASATAPLVHPHMYICIYVYIYIYIYIYICVCGCTGSAVAEAHGLDRKRDPRPRVLLVVMPRLRGLQALACRINAYRIIVCPRLLLVVTDRASTCTSRSAGEPSCGFWLQTFELSRVQIIVRRPRVLLVVMLRLQANTRLGFRPKPFTLSAMQQHPISTPGLRVTRVHVYCLFYRCA